MTILHVTGTRIISSIGKRNNFTKRKMIMNIYVGNLSYDATDITIREAFESFGQVTSARVIKDKYNGQSRGFGFVEMPAQSQAQTAIKSLNGKELLGKQISVDEAHPVVLCLGCGKEIVPPVPPPGGKKLLCMECFRK